MPLHCFPLSLAAYLLMSSLLSAFPGAEAASVIVTVEKIRSGQGDIRVSITDSAANFEAKVWTDRAHSSAQTGVTILHFDNLRPGRYLISCFHDENKNGFLDRGLFGIPVEGYGFSRNARGTFGPPDFDDAAIEVPEGVSEVKVYLGY